MSSLAADNQGGRVARRMLRGLGRLRDRHPEMTLLQAMAFFHVAAYPGTTQKELYKVLEVTDSAASRYIALLSDVGLRGVAGLDLVRMRVNPTDRRERFLELTAKGQRLMADIEKDVQ